MSSTTLLADVLGHPENQAILRWLGVDPPVRLVPWSQARSGYEPQGARFLLDVIAERMGPETKFALSYHHVLIHPTSAVIFGVLRGRYTFLLRRPGHEGRLTSYTLDALVDATELGPAWGFYEHEEELDDLEDDGLTLDQGSVQRAFDGAGEVGPHPPDAT